MTARTRTASTVALLLLATAATDGQVASNGITIIVDDDTLMPGESTTIRMEAYFDPRDYAMAGVATSLLSSAGAQGLSDLRLVRPMDGPGTSEGTINDRGVNLILAGQLNGLAGIYADGSNPIAFWEASYTAPSDVTTPFDVGLTTETIRFDVYFELSSPESETRLDDFAEGSATIRVVPAPAGALVLGGLLLTARRRC